MRTPTRRIKTRESKWELRRLSLSLSKYKIWFGALASVCIGMQKPVIIRALSINIWMKSTMGATPMEIEGEPTLTDSTIERLLKEKVRYHNSLQKFLSSFDYDNEDTYYLLSTKFLSQWKLYSCYDEATLNIKPSKGVPPEPYNINLLAKNGAGVLHLKPGLAEHADYAIVSADIMDIFRYYKGERIERVAYKVNGKKVVEIYGVDLSYFFLSQSILKDIANSFYGNLDVQKGNTSRFIPLKELQKGLMAEYERKNPSERAKEVRVRKLDTGVSTKKLYDALKSAVKPQRGINYVIRKAPGTLHEDGDALVDSLGITADDVLIIQVLVSGREWIFRDSDAEGLCDYCRREGLIPVHCGCKQVKYCSKECQKKDTNYHKSHCSMPDENELKEEIDFTITKYSRKGVCGLQNLGNTCFMNSCLQCLSNTTELTQYFFSKRFYSEINKNNPIGTKGKITMKYAKMVQALWCGTSDSYNPYILKSAIADFQPTFIGYNQHDSQELLSFLLDGLHEDLNRVTDKPFVESIDYKGESDEVFGFESWKNFLKRNQSIIVDLFMGQYKSKVVCPDCGFESITFDPYSTVSLPIPCKENTVLKCFVFSSNCRETAKLVYLEGQAKDIKAWKKTISKSTNLDSDSFDFYILSFNGECEEFNNKSDPLRLLKMVTSEKKDLFAIEHCKEELAMGSKAQLIYVKMVIRADNYDKRSGDTITYKRPFYWKIPKLAGREVYNRVFVYLFNPVIGPALSVRSHTNDFEAINKMFQKYFVESTSKRMFEVFLMSEPSVHRNFQKSEIRYQKEVLIQLNTPLMDLILDTRGELRNVEFEVRIKREYKKDSQQLNSYADDHKQNKSKLNTDDDIPEVSLEDCLKEFQKEEKLEPDNEWRCPKCKDFKQAFKSMSLYKTPRILILHLKRFKQKSNFSKSKISSLVKYPKRLNLNDYVLNKTLPEAYFWKENPKVNTKKSCTYELYAISNHMGSLNGGHYIACCNNEGKWYDFNDSYVSTVKDEERVVSNAGYLLFYKRIDK